MESESKQENKKVPDLFLREIGKVTVIGEQHLRRDNNPESSDEVRNRVLWSDVVVLEHPTDPAVNGWAIISPFPSYMNIAESESKALGKETYYLDDTFNMKLDSLLELYQQQGLPIDRQVLLFICGLKKSVSIPVDEKWFEKMVDGARNLGATESEASLMIRSFLSIYGGELTAEANKISIGSIRLDAAVRERHFQEKLSDLLSKTGDKSVAIVVGAGHVEGLLNMVADPGFRTELPEDTLEVTDLIKRTYMN